MAPPTGSISQLCVCAGVCVGIRHCHVVQAR